MYTDEYRYRHEHMFTLKPNQYVIMNKDVCPTFGLAWTQERLWEIAKQSLPYNFVELLCRPHHDDISLSNFFGYFGSPDSEVLCPNIIMNADEDSDTEKQSYSSFKERYGLIKCPIQINTDYMQQISDFKKAEGKELPEYNILRYMPKSRFMESNPDNKILSMQYNLINPTKMWSSAFQTRVYFPLYKEKLEKSYGLNFTLHDFVQIMGDRPFIILCFVCRNTIERIHRVRYLYIHENKLYTKDLRELQEITQTLNPEIFNSEPEPEHRFNPDVAEFVPAALKSKKEHVLNANAVEFKPLAGGAITNLDYKMKYLKYKEKYLSLKRNISS